MNGTKVQSMAPHYFTNVPLAGKTTLKIGGGARFYCQPESSGDISESLAWAGKRRLAVFVLGNGSNVLISDKGWPGLIIDIGARFDGITWEGAVAVCHSGAPLSRLVREMLDRKLHGLEALGGIPGSVGGALVMNAGSYGCSVSECVESVDYYDIAGGIAGTVDKQGLKAGYRRTVFSTMPAVILSGRFRFQDDPAGSARAIFDDCIAKRRQKHPLDLPNCGSVFKNPRDVPAASAASLIESSGLKGYRIGNVEVSNKHGNFIVNLGKGKAGDVRKLIAHIQKTVFEKHRVLLEPEVVFVGEFEEPLFRI